MTTISTATASTAVPAPSPEAVRILSPIEQLENKTSVLCSVLDCEKKGIFILGTSAGSISAISACIDHWHKLQFNPKSGRIEWFNHGRAMPRSFADMKTFLDKRKLPIQL